MGGVSAGAAAIAFGAAAAATAGAATIGQISASKKQQQSDREALMVNEAQAQLQAAEASYNSVVNFRKALASQVALASLRGGAGSVMRQFTSEAVANFMQDQEAIKRGKLFTNAQADITRRNIGIAHRTRTLNAFTQFASIALQAANFGMLGSSGTSKTPTTPTTPKGK